MSLTTPLRFSSLALILAMIPACDIQHDDLDARGELQSDDQPAGGVGAFVAANDDDEADSEADDALPPVDDDAAIDDGFSVGPGPEPVDVLSGWTNWTSEETPPIVCDPGSALTGFGCSGGNCDNIRLHCTPANLGAYSTFWTSYFSEEGTNYRTCPGYSWVTGMTCNGGSCDNISIQCTSTVPNSPQFPPKSPPTCTWTGWVSEENGGTLWLNSWGHVRGVQCSGGKCDNKRFYLCNF